MGGGSAESARRSLRREASPSTLAVAASGKKSRLAAQDRAAAKASSADHRMASADATAARVATGAARARDRASSRTEKSSEGDNQTFWGQGRCAPLTKLPALMLRPSDIKEKATRKRSRWVKSKNRRIIMKAKA